MQLADLFDLNRLAMHLENGNIAAEKHATEPLAIYCYTPLCRAREAWDEVTNACRGLIVHLDGTVIARPPERPLTTLESFRSGMPRLVSPVSVFDLVDGVAGIGYVRPSDGALQFATKTSFVSPAATWANQHVAEVKAAQQPTSWDRAPHMDVPDHLTVFVEIVNPDTQVVVDYTDIEPGLVHLCTIDTETGAQQSSAGSHDLFWPYGPIVERYPDLVANFEEWTVGEFPQARPNSQGYMLVSADGRTRVKIRNAEYMRLHDLFTKITDRTVWEYLRTDTNLDRLYDRVPEEFGNWLDEVGTGIIASRDEILASTIAHYEAVMRDTDYERDVVANTRDLRAWFTDEAAKRTGPEQVGLMLQLLDGSEQRLALHVMSLVCPDGHRTFRTDQDRDLT